MDPVKVIEAAIEKLGTANGGDIDAAIPQLISILSASMMVDDLTTNGFGIAVTQLAQSIVDGDK
jgi:hypothetical protein